MFRQFIFQTVFLGVKDELQNQKANKIYVRFRLKGRGYVVQITSISCYFNFIPMTSSFSRQKQTKTEYKIIEEYNLRLNLGKPKNRRPNFAQVYHTFFRSIINIDWESALSCDHSRDLTIRQRRRP